MIGEMRIYVSKLLTPEYVGSLFGPSVVVVLRGLLQERPYSKCIREEEENEGKLLAHALLLSSL